MSPQFEDLVSLLLFQDSVSGADSFSDYKTGYRNYLHACGIEYTNYGAFQITDGKASKAYFADSNFPEAWIEEYLTEGFTPHDYVLGRAISLNGKMTESFFLGEWLAPHVADFADKTATILRGAGDAGMQDGIGLVGRTRNSCGESESVVHWGFGLGGKPGTGHHIKEQITEITIASALVIDRLMPEIHSGIDRLFKPLSPRERDVLACFARGMQRDRTAHRLNIAVATVDLHSRNLRKKLGAATIAESIARAIRYGQL